MPSHVRIVTALAAVAVVSAGAVLLTRDTRALTDDRAADVNVSCALSQRAVIKQTMAGAMPQVQILCVDAASALTPAAIATPAVYYPEVLAPAAPASVRNPRVVQTSTAGTAPVRGDTQKPSWQKRVLIIGGSAGAGAGVGALIGGKKGALIGAAIGGGGATILDQVKNR